MREYFSDPEKVATLKQIADGWLGVKYRHMGCTKGGVDCTKLMALIFVEMGLLEKVEDMYYSRDWMVHGDVEVVLQAFSHHLCQFLSGGLWYQFLKYRPGLPMFPGDVICCSANKKRLCNHTLMYYDHDGQGPSGS